MPDSQFEVLNAWYEFAVKHFELLKPDAVVYIRTPPAVVFQRMQARGRCEEKDVDLQYLTKLHEFYEGWLGSTTSTIDDAPEENEVASVESITGSRCKVIRLDGARSANEVAAECDVKINAILI